MNFRLLAKHLGTISLLIAGSMLLSLPWAFPALGKTPELEWRGVWGIGGAILISVLCAAFLRYFGRGAAGGLYRREALAIVGFSWLLASVLGALPFVLSDTMIAIDQRIPFHDALFESASGFTGTGATVLPDVENAVLVPRSILFWRAETHFLGGLGILVLFVAAIGQGSAGKSLMLAEMPGPTKDVRHTRVQHVAWAFAGIYLGLNVVLTTLLVLEGMPPFDAICHSSATIATGGFSTYNTSVGHFNSVAIEMTICVFMFVACVNFALLYYLVLLRPAMLLRDVEFRTYAAILAGVILCVMAFELVKHDFNNLWGAFRYSVFNVTSVMTNTGFVTRDFDEWSQFARAALFLLMFVGGCVGSTSCSIKVIRYILLFKILKLDIEKTFRPAIVRDPQLEGNVADDPHLQRNISLYFGMTILVSAVAWVTLLAVEPEQTWIAAGSNTDAKFIDCASGVVATLNGAGPGLGTVGSTENYSHFSILGKFVFIVLMLLGRLELFPLLVLFAPRFWRSQ